MGGIFSGDPQTMIISILVKLLVLFTAFPIHECSHGLMAKFLGDDTAERQGRLTLNPFVHLDLMGSIFMILAGFGWAKPVQTNPRNYTRVKPKTGMAITAFAGPLSNILLAILVMVLYKVLFYTGTISNAYIGMALILIIKVNLFLAVFNLLPIPPLDGSRIALLFLKERTYFKIMQYERYIQMIFFIAIIVGFFDIPLTFLGNIMFNFIDFVTSFIDKILF